MDRMKNKVVLVFGAGSVGPGFGNGKAAAVAYAREGGIVVCVDVDLDAARNTVDVIESEGRTGLALAADVTKSIDIAAVVETTMERFGRIDVLHNNVGINLPGGAAEATEESWRKVMDVNLTSAFLTCKAVLPIMEKQGSGAIINISSLASIRWTGYPYVSYYASKAALNHFTRAIAIEYAAKGIRANAILPGLMDTPHIQKQISGYYGSTEEMKAKRDALSPMKRQGDGWDIAWASVFLASDEAKYITGVELPIDGGLHVTVSGSLN
ncbi:SDR family NAD(P)-dependent oxidoreductase [Neorhizobium galegae]|uniref:SDR family NAD(P)-dependent oxidoreductase n=1 Tax=Neorhizobium galegae TaxID=399 RepID=UPI000622747E|nr:SDR family NAD(P)-dependent oxidoreductase [Neorhizobium galegae]CDZ29730.1 Short-chain dehydrogenase/reductase SDR [Neorhizobium galegae bv. officinalis]KAA9385108.1 SDR family oxidoreductase [Neorhizobium galegae]KAB1110554.1 SDR family oxidoreductase [Neorhizobium galegae]MCM2501396.1 SDR family oxidoreductase [Neorhizobium galegae]MCQ1773596.1 SDR family oxidoreductase [Neorhizobium galegae]